ncbi:hypothetical protein [Actinomadura sp. 6N118]|uniref:hypothetical protein n=1 Tax=Actinomadura sp. 6N118 TaxID=3375151 RepID=UPI0037896DAD
MASHLRRGITALTVAALAGGLVVVPAGPASAKVYYNKRVVKAWGITGKLDIDHRGKGKWYARARFYNSEEYNAFFKVMLERKKGKKGAWRKVGSAGLLENGQRRYTTGWAWDGKGYQVRACIQHWSGAGYHGKRCSKGY